MFKQVISVFSLILVITGCQTTSTSKTEQSPPSSQNVAKTKQSSENAGKTETKGTVEMVYSEDWSFDWDLSQALRKADRGLILSTPEGISLNEIPEPLDKWLSRIKENGGTVKAKPIAKETDMKTRGLFSVLLDVVLYLIGVAKEEATFSAADEYNAILNYDKDTGTVKSVYFYKKEA